MAVLHGRNLVTGSHVLEVAPIPPSVTGPHDAYHVTLTHEGQVVYDQPHSVHGWQSGHYYVYDIAYAFQSAIRLLDARFDFSIYDVAPDWSNKRKETAHLHVSTDWLQFTISGRTDKRRGRLIQVFALLEASRDDSSGLERYLGVRFLCAPEEAEQFGKALQAECDAAEEGRKALGIGEVDLEDDCV